MQVPTRTSKQGKVYLVGAGPGDPRLVTLLGVRRLQAATLVLYDALVHPEVLRHAPNAVHELVGKRAGEPSFRQTAIHERMIEAAQAGEVVVRLKGGDPLFFARGAEELEALQNAGIAYEIVPGVSAPMAASAYANMPLTDRNKSSSVLFVTASEQDGKDYNWQQAARADTVVVFMAGRRLSSVAQGMLGAGAAADLPVAIIERASLTTQSVVYATLQTLHTLAVPQLPSLLVVGELAHAREASWFAKKPLFGRKILTLRAQHQAQTLSELLRDAGAEVFAIPAIAIAPATDLRALDAGIANLRNTDWTIFSSANGVHETFARMRIIGVDARAFGNTKLCTIGSKTAAALSDYGLHADLVPTEFRGEAVVAALAQNLANPSTITLFRAAVARDVIPNGLRVLGHVVHIVTAYQTQQSDANTQAKLRAAIQEHKVDTVVFTSPSTVHNLLQIVRTEDLARLTRVAIGPITGDALRAIQLAPQIEADEYTAEGIVDALCGRLIACMPSS